ncbi:MAG: hypothetical protein WCN64_03260 [Planctomycetota bacterium]
MSENSGSDRWKTLADELGLPPENPVSDVGAKISVNPHNVEAAQDTLDEDFLTFSKPKPVQRQLEPSKAPPVKTFPVPKVEPRHQPKETFVEVEEILEVTFGSHRVQEQAQSNKAQLDTPIVDAEIVDSNENSKREESNNQGEESTGSDRGRGGRGGDQDRGNRGRGRGGRGRGRDDNRNSNSNPNRNNQSPSRDPEGETVPAKMQPAPVRNERAAPVTFAQGPDSRAVISDDEVLSGPESYGSHHPEQDGEIDEIDLSTWSVPSWEDLIASLYKP